MERQKILFESGNELAAYAAKQINYHVMGYYPITPSTQIAEFLDLMKAEGEHDISLSQRRESTVQQVSATARQQQGQGFLMPPVPMGCCTRWNSFRYSRVPVFPWYSMWPAGQSQAPCPSKGTTVILCIR